MSLIVYLRWFTLRIIISCGLKVYAGTNIVAINIESSGVFGSCGNSADGDSIISKFPSEVSTNDANLDRKYSKSL